MSFGDLKRLIYYFPARWVSALLPIPWIAALGRLLAAFEYASIRGGNRRRLSGNIGNALGIAAESAHAKRLSREVVCHYVWSILEYGLAHRFKEAHGDGFIEVLGLEHVERDVNEGKGIVIAGGHLATFELQMAALAWKGYRTEAIILLADRPDRVSGLAEGWIGRFRARHQAKNLGYETIYTGGAIEQAERLLNERGVVVVGVDYPPARESATCTFLNTRQAVPSGAARLAVETGAAVYMAQLERLSFGHNRLTFSPVPVPQTGNRQADILALAGTLAERYEDFIRERPEQWAWLMWRQLGTWHR